MKRILALLTVILLVSTMAMSVMAADNEFVESITYKPNPVVVVVQDPNAEDATDATGAPQGVVEGTEYIAIIKVADQADATQGEIQNYVQNMYLVITPVADVWNEEADIQPEVKTLLETVYEKLESGEMQLPYDQVEGLDMEHNKMVIRDLIDISWNSEEYKQAVSADGTVLEMTFDLGVDPDAVICTMTYDEETNTWEPIVSTVNNGDGTVTCIFEHLCVVAFSVAVPEENVLAQAPVQAASGNSALWIGIIAVAVVAAAVVLVAKKKPSAAK